MRLLIQPLSASPRAAAVTLLFEFPRTSTPGLAAELADPFRPQFELGLLSPERVPEAAELLVDAFFFEQPEGGSSERSRAVEPVAALYSPLAPAGSSREERVRLTARGLEWRLGSRLTAPDLSLSLESSLLLALSDTATGENFCRPSPSLFFPTSI